MGGEVETEAEAEEVYGGRQKDSETENETDREVGEGGQGDIDRAG